MASQVSPHIIFPKAPHAADQGQILGHNVAYLDNTTLDRIWRSGAGPWPRGPALCSTSPSTCFSICWSRCMCKDLMWMPCMPCRSLSCNSQQEQHGRFHSIYANWTMSILSHLYSSHLHILVPSLWAKAQCSLSNTTASLLRPPQQAVKSQQSTCVY